MAETETQPGAAEGMHFQPPSPEDFMLVTSTAFGALQAHTLGAAVRLGIFEALPEEGCTVEQVSERCGTQPAETLRLLRALTSMGFTTFDRDVYRATAAGRLVDGRSFMSMKPMVSLFTDTLTVRAWEGLEDSIRSGRASFPDHFGKPFFDYLTENPPAAARFDDAMTKLGSLTAIETLFDFSPYHTVVDIGGGEGTFLARILEANPHLRGILFDSEETVERAREMVRERGLDSRLTCQAGDFFEAVPPDGDLYLMKGIMHDWNDAAATRILTAARRAMSPDAHLLLIDAVLDDSQAPPARDSYLMDLNLLVNFGGGERTAAQQRQLLRGAGFVEPTIRQLPPPAGIAFIESTPSATPLE